ncbi:carbohydrate ABC transporter substrate-binding protein (CUT1 family) [Shimia isoporae]|uniref:sn-glycerol-3-phosphate-binding periplasmic protein UgpB n=1 Tax=Shimia isoporae TaxID=647720 RepID=A0A4R1N3G2_9RHOB|nr:ABC transporter substrate-binding protein [Shimia isoporae]TCL00788.1 carbohydrate ABC transporter substrate-binding protein (CUT1 family) [Shimia isoporae]
MKSIFYKSAAIAALMGSAAPAMSQEIRFMCGSDGNNCEVWADIMSRFETENPGVSVVLDAVPYKAILENLPIQLAAGTGPDIAGVTDLGGLNEYYLDLTPHIDADYWNASFGDILNWYRGGPEDNGIYGLHTQMTVTGAYINRTLFDQAYVAVPAEDADWDAWAAAARQVAEKTGAEYPMAMDRSGHRIAGPAISYGAQYFDVSGAPMLVDEGFQGYVEKFVGWHEDGTMAREVWAGQGGSSYQDAANEFINGELVYYYSGSWQVGKFDEQIGDFFDWQVVGSPCGAGGCSGMPGGSGLVGFKQTKHPEVVAKLIDFLAREDNYAEMTARTRNIPAHLSVASSGVDYVDASAPAAAALNAWGTQLPKVSPIAFAYQGHPQNRAMFNITVQRVTQAIVGELSIDDAMARAKDDLKAVLEETQ